MKPASSSHAVHLLRSLSLLAMAAVLQPLLISAASDSAAPQATSAKGPTYDSAEFERVVDNAKRLAKANRPVDAERELEKLTASKRNSVSWHHELTGNLVQLATTLATEGSVQSVPAIASAAIKHLDEADTLTTDSRIRASGKLRAAFVHERLLGDPAKAIASLQTAVQLDPANRAAKEELGRLQRSDAILRARIHPKKK